MVIQLREKLNISIEEAKIRIGEDPTKFQQRAKEKYCEIR